jgi:hypothetical protein
LPVSVYSLIDFGKLGIFSGNPIGNTHRRYIFVNKTFNKSNVADRRTKKTDRPSFNGNQ